jgi:MarR family 2-MHQ and catechol resistance regulon transcriptional repressor
VRREACPDDRRARYAALTPAGTAFVERIFPEHAAAVRAAAAGLARDEQRQAARLLKQLGLAAAAPPDADQG